jgi:hypothetical protein
MLAPLLRGFSAAAYYMLVVGAPGAEVMGLVRLPERWQLTLQVSQVGLALLARRATRTRHRSHLVAVVTNQ